MTPHIALGEAPQLDGSFLRIAIIHARWNPTLISALVAGARSSLLSSGVLEQNITTVSVPGSYELPFACQRLYAASQVQGSTAASGSAGLAAGDLLGGGPSSTDLTTPSPADEKASVSKRPYDAVIAIGVLVKGETMHFEYIADAVSHGLMRVQLDAGVPVIFGLLTVLSEEQGRARCGLSGEGSHNHGEDWGRAAVELGVKRREWGEGTIA